MLVGCFGAAPLADLTGHQHTVLAGGIFVATVAWTFFGRGAGSSETMLYGWTVAAAFGGFLVIRAIASIVFEYVSAPTQHARDRTSLGRYAALLKAYPLAVGAPQQAVIVSLANITKQTLAASLAKRTYWTINWGSVWKAGCLGGIFMAPTVHCWYFILNRYVKNSTAKTLIDQLVMSWVFNTYAQLVLAFLNGEVFQFTRRHVELVLISWLWWIPVKGIMFRYLPNYLWLPYSACGSFVWNLIMFAWMGR